MPGKTEQDQMEIEKQIAWVKSRLDAEGLHYVEVPAPVLISIPSLEIDGELDLDLWLSFVRSKIGGDLTKGYFFRHAENASDGGQMYVYDHLRPETQHLLLWGEGATDQPFSWEDTFEWSHAAWSDGWDYGDDYCCSERITFLLRELNYKLVDLPPAP